MLKVNYSDLAKKTPNQIYKECDRRAIPIFKSNKFGVSNEYRSLNDLIGAIIAHDAYYEGRQDAINNRESKVSCQTVSNTKNRSRYCLRCEDTDPYYLRLNKEQADLIEWCISNEVYFSHAEFEEMDEVEWIEP